jgi:hypothetical protein
VFVRDEAYTKFILDYAATEDLIRKIWLQIQEERQTFQVCVCCLEAERRTVVSDDDLFCKAVVAECLGASIDVAKNTERGQIKGMALAKKACEGKGLDDKYLCNFNPP